MTTSSPLPPGNEKEIFAAAAALPPDERAACLDASCAGQPELRAAVEKLLTSLDDEVFMQRAADRTITAEMEAEMAQFKPEAPGDQIGNYTLREQIGEGGFGTVWVAEQEKPVRRRVALKIIKLGMDTKEVIARFEQERQALAMMDHPNIARVLDAGATSFGRPYFVMELVRGVKLTKYCDQANLPTAERLRLFIAVCHAVQHAHQKGIIHRDLKPSNILVTLHDGVPVPKVIDFGVAKATQQQRLTDLTIYTQFEQMIGTPLYMSPEQAEMSGLDIDTRSDIYSLGVLLYELLVGHTPFDPGTLMKAGFDEMRRVIREQEPQRPSTFVGTMAFDQRTELAKHRQTDSARLIGQIRGDLDWIVMKALEKDRTRRYETANGLALDIQRHLQDEPVLARPPTMGYRFRRMVRRNKLAFAAGSGIAAALVAGLGISAWMYFKEKHARERAVAAERAQHQVAQFLKDMLASVGPSAAQGRDTTMLREILDKTAERIGSELKDQPAVEADLRSTIGTVYHDLGDIEEAGAMHSEALAIRRKLFGSEHMLTPDSLIHLSRVRYSEGDLAEAETLARDALAIRINLHGKEHVAVAAALQTLGHAVNEQGRLREAESLYREALALLRTLQGNEHTDVAGILTLLAHNLGWQGNQPEAEKLLREAVAIRKKQLGNEDPGVIYPLHYLARSLLCQKRPDEAVSLSREALTIAGKVYGGEHKTTADQLAVLCSALVVQGRRDEAEAMILKAPDVAKARSRLIRMLMYIGQSDVTVVTVCREELARLRKTGTVNPRELEELLHLLASSLYRLNHFAEAEPFYRETLTHRQARLPASDRDVIGSAASLARLLADWAWSARVSLSGTQNLKPEIADRAREAERLLRDCLTIRMRGPEATHWRTTGDVPSRLGGALVAVAATDVNLSTEARQAKLAEAEKLLLKANEVLQSRQIGEIIYRRDSLERIVRLYEAWGRQDKAADWQQKLDAFNRAERISRNGGGHDAPDLK